MDTSLFFVSLLIALIGPVIAITYLKPILYKVLRMLCDADGGAEFWIRCAYLLAVTGTLLLMLTFGEFSQHSSVVDTVRRSLWLVLAGVFVTVALISGNVWNQVRQWVAVRETTRHHPASSAGHAYSATQAAGHIEPAATGSA